LFVWWGALIAFLAGLGTLTWVLAGAALIAYIATHPPRRRVKKTPAKFGAPFEEVRFASRDGVTLSGWYIPAPPTEPETKPRGAIVLCHGMSAHRAQCLFWAEPLWNAGYALLLFDFRGNGMSEGTLCSAGFSEPNDLLGAMDFLSAHEELQGVPFGVFGFSMGGATAIMTAAQDERIRAIATHGAFASLESAISQRCRHHFGPLRRIAQWYMMRVVMSRGWFPAPVSEVAPVSVVSQITPRPLLLLHGSDDPIVTPEDAEALHEAAGFPKALVVLPRSGHHRIHRPLREDARVLLTEFFQEHLSASSESADDSPRGHPRSRFHRRRRKFSLYHRLTT
jgi:uncharacterized protein